MHANAQAKYSHPANVLNNFYIIQRSLLQLKKFGCLLPRTVSGLREKNLNKLRGTPYHQVLQLQRALWHIVALTPLLDTGDVIVDLQPTLPGEEITTHQEIIERGDAY